MPITRWQGRFSNAETAHAVDCLESGKVLYFPDLSFSPDASWAALFSAELADQKAKNVSYDVATGLLKGTAATDQERTRLQQVMANFSNAALQFVRDLFPAYADHIEQGRTSFRPVEITGRDYSPLKDDKLLHVDAFPSTPTRGRRILRLFSNVNPHGTPRIWHVGEPFAQFAPRFLPGIKRPSALAASILAAIGATRGRRSAYDQLMLGLHNAAKRDGVFQQTAPHEEIAFPAGSSWLCFTDQVVHAAVAGQYALEQTFYLGIEAMAEPAKSPLRTLERMTQRQLC